MSERQPDDGPDRRPACLWLTRVPPYPAHAGDKIYTAKLVEALAAQDCAVTVLCTEEDAGALPPDGPARRAAWVTVPPGAPGRMWAYPFSRLPRQALLLATPAYRAALEGLLRRQRWDAIVVDFVAMGWVLPLIEGRWPAGTARPPLVYVSHNHEASLRRAAARESTRPLPKRVAQHVDAERVAALEARLVSAADLVTVNTGADLERYRRDAPAQEYEVLVPGYDGPVLRKRTLTPDTPRRVVVVGSFGWIVKQQNLMEFLETAAQPLAARGIGIDIVGSGPADVLAALRRRFPSVTIHGAVERVEPYLQAARISVIPERVGGGFKHKVLNAVFLRTPVFALSGTITGIPLEDGRSVRACAGFDELVRAIIEGIDDLDALNALQQAAFVVCDGRFDWLDRGHALRAAIERAGERSGGSAGQPDPRCAQRRPVAEEVSP
jgi:glycosyltransferase involved in cell wall biosynthesis